MVSFAKSPGNCFNSIDKRLEYRVTAFSNIKIDLVKPKMHVFDMQTLILLHSEQPKLH